MIEIKNKHTYKGDGEYIGRGSPLGNPYSHLSNTKAQWQVKTRQEAIDKYYLWFLTMYGIGEGEPVYEEIWRLVNIYKKTGKLILICYCEPLPCHGEIIRRMIYGLTDDRHKKFPGKNY
jgi:hypothetical protein